MSNQKLKLTQPYDKLGFKNRMVMAPMTRCKCDDEGLPSKELGDYYIERAKAGVGLIIIESCSVNDTDARGYRHGCQLNNKEHAQAWKLIVDEIHTYGTRVWVQIFHAGRLTVPQISDAEPMAPSAIRPEGSPSFWRPEENGQIVHFQTKTPFVEPKKMELDDIERVLSDFEYSCRLAVDAGFDGVEIHGAHGYLVHEFCSKFANKRDDEYGLSKGFLFATELVARCKKELSDDMQLSYRLSTHMIDNNYLRMSDVELQELIPLLEQNGVDVFHSSELMLGEMAFRSNCSLGEAIRALTSKPLIGCGRVSSLLEGENIINTKCYDMIAYARALIIDKKVPICANEKRFDYIEHFNKL